MIEVRRIISGRGWLADSECVVGQFASQAEAADATRTLYPETRLMMRDDEWAILGHRDPGLSQWFVQGTAAPLD